jgi:ABC-2 type transport system permease protein
MEMTQQRRLSFFLESSARIFSFFFFYGKKARRTKVFYSISLFPGLMAAVIKIGQLFSSESMPSGIEIFSNMILVFYLQFFVLILALFFGTSVCSEEVEGKTLTYLTTRPIPKSAIIIGKYAAYCALGSLMTVIGMAVSFLILNFENMLDLSLYPILFKDMGVMVIGVACYMGFFTFIGTLMRKSILFGLVFSFGWENVIQYFPGSTQRFAVVHYLKSLLPSQHSGSRFSILLFQLEPTSPGTAIAVLLLLTIVFLALASYVFAKKEYILED